MREEWSNCWWMVCVTERAWRISETLGLKWEDIEVERGQANVLRFMVEGEIGDCMTEISRRPGETCDRKVHG